MRGEGIRQSQHCGQLRTEQRRPEDVQGHVRAAARSGVDAGYPRGVSEKRLQFQDILREGLGRLRVASKGPQGAWSVPGARPRPRSIRPGCSVARVPNCSAMTSGEWFGSMTPPEPSRMVEVLAATCAMSTAVADDAIVADVVVLGVPDAGEAEWLRTRASRTLPSRLSRTVSPATRPGRGRGSRVTPARSRARRRGHASGPTSRPTWLFRRPRTRPVERRRQTLPVSDKGATR